MTRASLITDTVYHVLDRDGWHCQFPECPRRATETAHKIAKTQANTKMVRRMWQELTGQDVTLQWAWDNIINNKRNLESSCRPHNPYFNCGNNKGKCWEILTLIRDDMKNQGGVK